MPDAPAVLITGAARRVGAEIARQLHAAGCDLALHHRHSADAMQALVAELEQRRPGSTLSLCADLADIAGLPRLIDATLARFGRLDGLVNNASAFYATPLDSASETQWDELMTINAKAPFFLAQAAAPHLRASGGAIVNIIDIYGERPRQDLLLYAASKASLQALTRSLALALAPQVRVNAVSPGAIIWPEAPTMTSDQEQMIQRTPMQRIGRPDEVASTVVWLLRGAGYVTGQTIIIDGGRTIAG